MSQNVALELETKKCFHGSIYSCSWVGYTVGVFNHQTFLFNVACMLYFTCCQFISHLSRCLSTACNYLYPPLCLPPSAITPTQTLFTCSPVSDLLISPTFTSTPPPQTSPPGCLLCVWGHELKTMNIFRNFILETLMQKLTAASWLVSTNLKKKEESSRHWWKMKK